MLKNNYDVNLTSFDLLIFETVVPADHYLRQLKAVLDFSALRALVADCYSPDQGRGAIDPVFLLKLLLLQFHYGLSDEGLIRQVQVNMAFRFFLDLPLEAGLPEPSLLSQFRTRLGEQLFTRIFDEVLRQARAKGLVKDRLRLKDATHLIADIAVPATIRLVAQTREQLLAAAEAFAPDEVAAHRQNAEQIRQATVDVKDEARLLRRVEHLRGLVVWGAGWQERLELGAPPVSTEVYEALVAALSIARKVLNDREPKASDKIVSLTDAVGYNGAVLKALSDDPDGPQLTVYAPPKETPPRHPDLSQPDDFKLNEAGDELSCPRGETTRTRYRDHLSHGWVYHFSAKQCRHCPLRAQCLTPNNKRPIAAGCGSKCNTCCSVWS